MASAASRPPSHSCARDRNTLRSEARLLEGRLAEADLDSLQTELENASKECERLEAELEKVTEEHDAAEEDLKSARQARAALDGTYREHSRLTSDLREAEADRRRAEDRRTEAEKDLADLAAARRRNWDDFKPQTARLPEVAAELEQLDEDRRRSEQRDRVVARSYLKAQRRISDIEGEVSDELEALDGDKDEVLSRLPRSLRLGRTGVALRGPRCTGARRRRVGAGGGPPRGAAEAR